MERIVQVGDVFRGGISDRLFTVTKVTAENATMKWECHEWDRPLTPRGTLVEEDRYKFVASAPTPALREGDRVRTTDENPRHGIVAEMLVANMLMVIWDGGYKALLHASDVELDPTPVTPETDDLMPGDRVRFKYNKKAGTVVRKHGNGYMIQWDHRADIIPEHRHELVVLYAPRATDAPLPAQKAIDEVDALREEIKAKVADLQGQLRALNGVKNKLKGIEA